MLITPSPRNDDFLLQEWFRQVRDFLTVTKSISLDFGNTLANTNTDLTVNIAGAKSGDTVIATPPSTIEAGLTWCAFVSANDTVKVRIHAYGTAAIDPAPAVWRITLFRY